MVAPNDLSSETSTAGPVIPVAVVEDDAWLLEDLAREISAAPCFRCVAACRTGEEALDRVPSCSPEVVVMDINLPGMSGIDCVRLLKERLPDLSILMLTVYEESDSIFAALRAGASGYLLKRSSSAELLAAIAEVHGGGSPMTPSVARRVVQFFATQSAAASDVEGLTVREKEILGLLAQGHAYKEIGDRLSISLNTIRMFIRRIYRKLHVHSRGQAVARFLNR